MSAVVRFRASDRPSPQPASRMEVRVARTLDELMQALSLRSQVYIGEQACPYGEEFDGNDFTGSTHLILYCGGDPVGTLRMRWFAEFAKLERAAIRKDHRGRRSTVALMLAAVELARRKGYRKILGHAQARLAPFWARTFGARPRPGRETFVFSDHDYVEMEVDLEPRADALTLDSDPLMLLRPEGDWDRPGVLDRSAVRLATNPAA